jgi:pimeloyl-ACP methyl ester carboxylesterase
MKRGFLVAIVGVLCTILVGCAPFVASPAAEVAQRAVQTPAGPLRLAFTEQGHGRPILLLHGFATSGYTWHDIVPELAKNHRVIALDLRGFGASDKPIDEHYSIIDQAQAVEAFIKQENLRDVTIIGHSFGGGVTLALALKLGQERPSYIRNLVLIDSIAYRQPLPIFFRLLKVPMVAELSMTLVPPEVQATQALRIAYHDQDKISARAIAEYASPLYSPAAKHALTQTVNHIIPDDIDDISERYKTLKLPTLILWCHADKVVPVALGHRLHENIPSAELTVFADCGHLPQEEKPEDTARVIQSFLARTENQPPAKKAPSR